MKTEYKFWVVWQPASGTPTVKHLSKEIAMAEAQRLAIANPGKEFFVMEATDMCVKDSVQWVSLDEYHIAMVPF